jgi:hypothetical protein
MKSDEKERMNNLNMIFFLDIIMLLNRSAGIEVNDDRF